MNYLSTSLQGPPGYFNFKYENVLRLKIAVIRFYKRDLGDYDPWISSGAVIDLFARHHF